MYAQQWREVSDLADAKQKAVIDGIEKRVVMMENLVFQQLPEMREMLESIDQAQAQ
jgi:hypothetical protein